MKIPNIDLNKLRCSLLLVEPKEELFEWLVKRIDNDFQSIYYRGENGVYIFPPIQGFNSEEDIEKYIITVKPRILERELMRFIFDEKYLKEALEKGFDYFLTFEIRDFLSKI